MGPETAAIVAVVSSLASGTVGFIGAQRQADAMEAQAKRAEQMGKYNAQVARNNALAQSHDLRFQADVADFNRKSTITDRDFRLSQAKKEARRRQASLTADLSRQGLSGESLDDILASEAMLAEEETMEIFRQQSERGFQYSAQGKRNRFMGQRSIEQGRQSSALAFSEGRARATSLSNQAGATRWSGYGSLASGIGGAASTGYTAYQDKVFG